MRNLITKIMIVASILSFFGCKDKNSPSGWDDKKLNDWFSKGEWKNGWNIVPDASINKRELAIAYFKNKTRWDIAFKFLKDNDLSTLEKKRHDVDGDNLFVNVSEYDTKEWETANFEAHRKYADIQYVVTGKEMIGMAPLASADSIVQPYDEKKDIEFLKTNKGVFSGATSRNFFIFFPGDAHMPSLKADTISHVRKVVVKVRLD